MLPLEVFILHILKKRKTLIFNIVQVWQKKNIKNLRSSKNFHFQNLVVLWENLWQLNDKTNFIPPKHFQNHHSEKMLVHLNFHLFGDFLGFRISKIRKKNVTKHNPFFLMKNIQSLLNKNEICLLVLMNFTFYFEIKRKNPVFSA